MFVFYHGESYDYIGSSRMIYDMENNAFPHRLQPHAQQQSSLLKLEDIGMVIELDQVTKNEIYYHSMDRISHNNETEMISDFILALKQQLSGSSVRLSGSIGRLPPSSLQRFLKKDRNIKGVVLSSYNSTFDNIFYHSIFDTGKNLNYTYYNKTEPQPESIQRHLTDFSVAVAQSLYLTLFKTSPPINISNKKMITLVDELLYCYLVSPSCEIFQNVTFLKSLDDKPYSVYVGVLSNSNVTTLTGLTLAWLTGERVQKNRTACHNNETDLSRQYFWMADEDDQGVCVESLMNYSLAQSPAFVIKDYDWTSQEYSTWTESVWQEKMSARAFIKPSRKQEILSLLSGLLVFIFSFVIVYFISSKANILFNQQALRSAAC
ncbi:hypothetical protein RUM44_004685 [Polyplax serrata]|uniref:Nicastrin n=1 Tax=Polyplax serrata TaxID=468196 RepID=A0ABR1B5D2_POLSC